MASSKNLYHRRLVAESAAKACWICYKPTATVLITPDQDDWFHICPGHLSDAKFALAKDAEDLAEKRRKEALDKEIESVKREYEEKMRRKIAKRKSKDDKDDKSKKKKEEEENQDEQDEKEKEEKLKQLEKDKEPAKATVEGPRVFELHKSFYQMRLQKKRDVELARRNRDRLRNPASFPSVPSGDLS